MTIHTPRSAEDLAALFADATANGSKLELRGGGSKAAIGADRDAAIVDMRGFSGIVDYDPPELVLTVRPGTPLAEIEALVAAEGQMLAFEPYDHGPLLDACSGTATIGGVVAAGVAGSGRLTMGGARDHLLHAPDLRTCRGDQKVAVAHQVDDGNEVLEAPRQFLVQRFAGCEVRRRDQHRIAVRRRSRDEFGPDVG